MRDKDSLATGAGPRSTFESLKKSLVSSQENSQRIKTTIELISLITNITAVKCYCVIPCIYIINTVYNNQNLLF